MDRLLSTRGQGSGCHANPDCVLSEHAFSTADGKYAKGARRPPRPWLEGGTLVANGRPGVAVDRPAHVIGGDPAGDGVVEALRHEVEADVHLATPHVGDLGLDLE